MGLAERYRNHLAKLAIPAGNLLDFLQEEAERFKSQVSREELQERIGELEDAWNGQGITFGEKSNRTSTDSLFKGRDQRWIVEFRLHCLMGKIRSLEKRPGHELELGWAYLERTLLEDIVLGDMQAE